MVKHLAILTRKEIKMLLAYVYRLEVFAEHEGFDARYTDTAHRAIEKLQEAAQ